MKYIILFSILLLLFSCKDNSCEDKNIYSNKFEEFISKSDTLSKLGNSTYNSLVDSLTIRLNNYYKITSGSDSLGMLIDNYFSMTKSIESSRIYYIKITLFKNDKLAFEKFANRIVLFIDDSVSINKLKNFKDIINVPNENWKFVYLENMTIELYEPFNDINLYFKKLLAEKNYKELELSREGAFWTKNSNWH